MYAHRDKFDSQRYSITRLALMSAVVQHTARVCVCVCTDFNLVNCSNCARPHKCRRSRYII